MRKFISKLIRSFKKQPKTKIQPLSIATRMLSEDVDDEYIRLCYNWEE